MVTHEHAVEVDTALADLWGREQKAGMKVSNGFASLHSTLGHKRGWSKSDRYTETPEQTETEAREVIANPVEGKFWHLYNGELRPLYSVDYLRRALGEIDAGRAEYAAAKAEAKPLEDEFRAEQWRRYFLVVTHDGHIHKDMHCSTTFPTTLWSWLPTLSGLTEDAAVEEQGPRLCSVCFPSAPVEWTVGLPKKVNDKRCPGSGERGERIRYSRYGKCPVCGHSFAMSESTGRLRAHNKPEA